ncbi:restriction endonuclease subunit S [Mycoplasma tullyi]|uniref:Restriction endonuclease subunit S n=2 Tax=Mycoplasma tullyi TaxID=1612150 RepID=A0A7D7U599_9MOLU|nr:restriction endonuclease subunit S [Mycoplasma tullyi]
MPDILRIRIPLPPLKIQNEIVKVFDIFVELTTELTTELNLRSSQYVYYRDKLLDFDQNQEIRIKKLGEMCSVKMGKRVLNKDTNNTKGIPFHTISTLGHKATKYISKELFNQLKRNYPYPSKEQILISTSGTIGKIVEFDGKNQYFQDSNIVWLENDEKNVLNKYLYYFLQTKPWNSNKSSTIERLYNKDLEQLTIKMPSLTTQNKIVNFLNNFELICLDLNIGLPKETELRNKQYEYYRDQIFNYLNTGRVDTNERERERERES